MTDTNKGVALVTNASSGIGLINAQALLKAGYQVEGTSRKPSADLQDITMLVCDVTNEVLVKGMIEEVAK